MAFEILDKPSLPWILLVLSLIIPRNKEFAKNILSKQKTPWVLLAFSWAYFAVGPQDPAVWLWNRFHKLFGGKSSRLYTATLTAGKTATRTNRKIVGQRVLERIPAEGESSSAETLVPHKKALLSEMDISELMSEVQEIVASRKAVSHHRFDGPINLAKEMLKRVFPLKDGWTTVKENDGVLISNLPIAGLELPWIRGDGIISGNFTVSEVLSVIQNAFARKVWDARFDQSEILEYLDNSSFLIHSVQKGTFPVAPRDFLTSTSFYFQEDGYFKSIDYVATSVKDAAGPAPDSLGRVRAEILLAGWRLLVEDGGVKASYIVHVDVKGSVPSAIIKAIQTQTPMCIKKIEAFLHELGPLPFILGGPFAPHSMIQFTKRDTTDVLVSLAYIIQPEAYVDESEGKKTMDPKLAAITIALPARTFGNGASITCKGLNAVFQGALLHTELVSEATSYVVQIWPSVCVPEVVNVTLEIVPSTNSVVQLNSTTLSL